MITVSHSATIHLCKEPDSATSIRTGGSRCPEAFPSPGWTIPAPSASPHWASHGCLGNSLLKSLQLIDNLHILGGLELNPASQTSSDKCWARRNNFPSSPGCAPAYATRGAVSPHHCQEPAGSGLPSCPQDPQALLCIAAAQTDIPSLFIVGCWSVSDTGQGFCPGWISWVSCQLVSPI